MQRLHKFTTPVDGQMKDGNIVLSGLKEDVEPLFGLVEFLQHIFPAE